MIIALLLFSSSCGIKGSDSFYQVNFVEKTSVAVEYKGEKYIGTLQYNGNVMELCLLVGKDQDKFCFIIDSMTCTTDFLGLKKTEQTKSLSQTYLPVVIFEFLYLTGAQFKTELYDEKTNTFFISRNVGNINVCLEIIKTEEKPTYTLKIN